MNPEAQNRAIAEAIGWKTKQNESGSDVTFDPSGRIVMFSGGYEYPDFLNDLNEMHKAEKEFGFHDCELGQRFAWFLYLVVINYEEFITFEEWQERGNELGEYSLSVGARATASQRAETFLRATGLWVDSL